MSEILGLDDISMKALNAHLNNFKEIVVDLKKKLHIVESNFLSGNFFWKIFRFIFGGKCSLLEMSEKV